MRRLALLLAAVLAATPLLAASARLTYPDAPRDPKPDTYFGTTVPDPYRWLENVDSPQTQAWVQAEGDLTRSYLDAVPQRGAIRDAYRKLLDYEKVSAPFRAGRHWFFSRNSGLQNQSVLYVRDGERAPARVLLDPNRLAADGTVALGGQSFTNDGRYLAYATQASGSDWQTWHVRDVASGKDLADRLEWSKFSDATWVGDRGFYYSAYDEPSAANTTLVRAGRAEALFPRAGHAAVGRRAGVRVDRASRRVRRRRPRPRTSATSSSRGPRATATA